MGGSASVSSGGAAIDVSYDNTESGLSAVNVQEAIDELAGEISPTQSVRVTADGVKTDAALLNELYALADLSKLSAKSTARIDGIFFQCRSTNPGVEALFFWIYCYPGHVYSESLFIKSSGSGRYYSDNNSVTDKSSQVPAFGVVFEITY